MNNVDILFKQTSDAYQWTNKLIDSTPYELWNTTPEVINSNLSWQTGHLIMSFYYHTAMVIVGHQPDILQQIPLKEYSSLYTFNTSPEHSSGKIAPEQLHEQLRIMEEKSLHIIEGLTEENLEQPLEPVGMEHPVANNKFEALDWNIKHTMWHCGQISIIKRTLNEGYDFGLK